MVFVYKHTKLETKLLHLFTVDANCQFYAGLVGFIRLGQMHD